MRSDIRPLGVPLVSLSLAACSSGPPEELFSAPREERTRRFLQRIIDAGRL
ncbi:MAG: hypothetical protein ACJ765_10490 [Chloroflexota bacterium]